MGEYGRLPRNVQSKGLLPDLPAVAPAGATPPLASQNVFTADDEQFMRRALELAAAAANAGEVPVGAVVVAGACIVGEGWNSPVATNDPTAHAEVIALRNASSALANYRLPGTTLYCSLEPCVMCAGALVLARIGRLVFAARDLRFGGVRSKFALADSPLLNHRMIVQEGLLAPQASELLASFFQSAREKILR